MVDGASTDQTVEILESYKDHPELDWVSEPDRGVVDAVNKGFKRVDGEIVGIQSSDDMYLDGTIRTVVESFRSAPAAGLVYGDTLKVDASGIEILRQRTGDFSLRNLLTFKTWIPQPLDVLSSRDARYLRRLGRIDSLCPRHGPMDPDGVSE